MEHIWEVPDAGFMKINVHCEISQAPLANGNTVAVGSIIRDETGRKMWGSLGVVNELLEEQAILLGIQAACIHCLKMIWEFTHIETSNIDVHETIRLQEHIVLNADHLEAYGLFNTVQANHYKQGITHKKLSCIPQHMNATAKYMSEYGIRHMTCFAEAPGNFGDLNYYLERDMGLVLASPIHELVPNFGEGEVVDASPPPPLPLKRRRESINMPYPDVFVNSSLLKSRCFGFEGKGKEKMYKEFAFYDDGKLSARALEIIDSGCLNQITPVFAEKVIDLESHVGNGFFAKDVLPVLLKTRICEMRCDARRLIDESEDEEDEIEFTEGNKHLEDEDFENLQEELDDDDDDVFVNSSLLKSRCFGFEGKGKEKMYKEFAFYDDGKLSARALEIIDSGCLNQIAPVFAEKVIDLESRVGNGTLEIVLPLIQNTFPALDSSVKVKEQELMPVDEVLTAMGFLNDQECMEDGLMGKRSKRASSV
ncbi:hypothetical protein ACET3Z_006260 [Daucus carota]